MTIYIYNEYFFSKIRLPQRITGVYQIYGIGKKFIANIEEKNEKWSITPSNEINILNLNTNELNEYDEFILEDRTNNQKYYIYASPSYENNMLQYQISKETITIGNKEINDIQYNHPTIQNGEIKLIQDNNYWIIDTNLPNVFIMDERLKERRIVYNGDYIFFHGLKIIILGKKIIINNPKNKIKVNTQSLIMLRPKAPNQINNSILFSKDLPLYTKDDYFFKSPRFEQVIEEEEIKIDEPPEPLNPDNTPLILTIGPQLTMICTSGISIASTINMYSQGTLMNNQARMYFTIATIAVTMVGAFMWPNLIRKYNNKLIKQKEAKRQKKYRTYLDKKRQEIEYIKLKQKQILIDNATTFDRCKQAIEQKNRILWQRNIEHDDFLQVRLGTGRAETKIKITIPEEKFSMEETDHLYKLMETTICQSLTIENIPQNLNLTDEYITGVVGPDELAKPFIDGLFLQIMALHAYTELKIIVYTENEKKWNYLKILPHCWDNQKTIRYFARTIEELNEITMEIEKTFDNRLQEDESEKTEDDGTDKTKEPPYKKYKPYYLIFTDDITSIRNVSLIKKILKYKVISVKLR